MDTLVSRLHRYLAQIDCYQYQKLLPQENKLMHIRCEQKNIASEYDSERDVRSEIKFLLNVTWEKRLMVP